METELERIRKILRDAFDATLLERDTTSEAFDEILRAISRRLPHPDDAWRIKSASSALSVAREKMSVAMIRLRDFEMPGMSGIAFAIEITRQRPNIKVLLMSGYNEGMLVLNEGWHFLAKPFIPSQLRTLITGLVSPDLKSRYKASA